MEALLPDILSDLNVIASISEGDTITTSGGKIQVIQHDGAGATRLWRGETRDTTLQIIKKKISYATEYSSAIMESIYLHKLEELDSLQISLFNKRYMCLKNIRDSLTRANEGIQKLRKTYRSDSSTDGNIKALIGEVGFHINVLEQKINELDKQVRVHNRNSN